MAERYPTILAGQRITASLLSSMQPQVVIKLADESRASTTTMANDSELSLSVEANATYALTSYIVYSQNLAAGASAGIAIGWSGPTSATLRWTSGGTSGPTATTTQDVTAQPIGSTRSLPANLSTFMAAMVFGKLVTSSTAGTLYLQWAQVASDATPTIVRSDSWMQLRRTS